MRPLAGLRPGQQDLVFREAMRVCDGVCDPLPQKVPAAFQLDPRGFPVHVQKDWILRFGTLEAATFDPGDMTVSRDDMGYQFESKGLHIWKQLSRSQLDNCASPGVS